MCVRSIRRDCVILNSAGVTWGVSISWLTQLSGLKLASHHEKQDPVPEVGGGLCCLVKQCCSCFSCLCIELLFVIGDKWFWNHFRTHPERRRHPKERGQALVVRVSPPLLQAGRRMIGGHCDRGQFLCTFTRVVREAKFCGALVSITWHFMN